MSTRANIKVIESWKDERQKVHTNELLFYRHSDGYPKGTMPTLELFMNWVKNGMIRNNVGQAAGWLVVIGAIEYQSIAPEALSKEKYTVDFEPKDWKVGAYEPAEQLYGDIEFLYEIDLTLMEIRIMEVTEVKNKQVFTLVETKKF